MFPGHDNTMVSHCYGPVPDVKIQAPILQKRFRKELKLVLKGTEQTRAMDGAKIKTSKTPTNGGRA
jgi:hypothetical protein